jgi:hypothetical protein
MIINKAIVWLILIITAVCICILYILTNKKLSYLESFENGGGGGSSSSGKCVVYKLHHLHGLFADLGFFIESYIRAKRAGMPFYVDSKEWSYKANKGWHDYFKSFQEVPENNVMPAIICSHSSVPTDIDGNQKIYLKDVEVAAKEIFVLTDSLQSKVDDIINSYGTYEALYIRRGDKMISESVFKPTSDILSQIQLEDSLPLFVQTDDYAEVKNIKSINPQKKVVTIVPEVRSGAHESHRQTMTPQEREETTNELLMGMMICMRAKKCYVDISSNVSRFIKIYSPDSVFFYKLGNEIPNYFREKEITNIAYMNSFT